MFSWLLYTDGVVHQAYQCWIVDFLLQLYRSYLLIEIREIVSKYNLPHSYCRLVMRLSRLESATLQTFGVYINNLQIADSSQANQVSQFSDA